MGTLASLSNHFTLTEVVWDAVLTPAEQVATIISTQFQFAIIVAFFDITWNQSEFITLAFFLDESNAFSEFSPQRGYLFLTVRSKHSQSCKLVHFGTLSAICPDGAASKYSALIAYFYLS
ncbi:hypothetical protein WA026_012026 [Henosepilachna vigintioctopunctata]|uniref:Uncharacterized protein n=1 Tax=Henosepilachna vigintioctopunctata TaxID=420089 RepID=A0AAW1VB40_9CUCU